MENTSPAPIQVSFRVLLGLYLVMPLCLAAYLIDKLFLNSIIQRTLPMAPETYFYFALFFGLPHIMASNFILATNGDYLRFYKWKLLRASAVIIAFLVVGTLYVPAHVMFFIFATVTIVHVVRQQLGIGNIVAQMKGVTYQVWFWSVIAGSVIMYNGIFIGNELPHALVKASNSALLGVSVVVFIATCILQSRLGSLLSQGYLWGNAAIALVGFFLYSQNYYFLAVLGPRIVHDVTAFIFYVTHDRNRHTPNPQNSFYAWMNKCYIHPFIALPLVAVTLTYVLQRYGDSFVRIPGAVSLGFLGYLTYMHYYTESFTWKGTSPYRKFISFRR